MDLFCFYLAAGFLDLGGEQPEEEREERRGEKGEGGDDFTSTFNDKSAH